MKRIALAMVVTVAAFAFSQTLTRTYVEANVVVDTITLTPLSDGGCAAAWSGRIIANDGDTTLVSLGRELGGATNQNRCDGLRAAGAKALANKVGIIADAGAI